MTKDSQQIEQAIEAVRRQPGSPAYAFLAEHYLEEGSLDEAARTCRAGFAANPGFERGAVAYLAVLRRLGELDTAGEVYGRAVAYLPRSARVRMAWALVLADVGREREARNLAREALDLDPLNREARAFIATLGGTPTPTLTSEGPAGAASRGQVAIVPEGKLRAEVRPWVRPIGQRTTPHSMFDLTPTPEILSEQVRKELSIFDLPAPDEEPEERTVEVLVPVDLFEDTAKPEPPIRPVPAQPPLHPAATPSSLVRAVRDPIRPTSTPPPPPLRASPTGPGPLRPTPTPAAPLRAVSTGPQPLRPTPTPRAPLHLDQELEIEPEGEAVPVGVPIEPSLDFEAEVADSPDAPPGRAHPTGTLSELQYRPRRRRWLVPTALALVVALGGGVAGYLLYTQRARRTEAARAVQRMDSDLLEGYLDARRELQALVRAHPDLTPALGGLALADAHLCTRFGSDASLEAEAKRLAEQALARGPSPSARAALALLAIRAGGAKLAASALAAVPAPDRRWHHQLVAVLLALALGETDRARALLEESTRGAAPAPALLLEAAQLHHRNGEPDQAAKAAARGLAVSPQHPGLRLLALLTARDLDASALGALEPAARAVPRYRAALSLARALAAERSGAVGEARRQAEAALQADPQDPQVALHAARLLGGAGGDLPRAVELLAPGASKQTPGVRIRIAALLLRSGQPHEARTLLDGIAEAKLADPDRALASALSVRTAALAEDAAVVDRRCALSDSGLAANRATIVFCAEARSEQGQPGLIERLGRLLPAGAAAESRYLAGLRLLALGETGGAALQLGKVDRLELDPAAPLLALGHARMRGGEQTAAVAILRKALAADAGSTRARIALASAYCASGLQADAQPLLEAIAKEKPTQPSLIAAAGECYLALGQPARAQALIDAARSRAGDASSLRLLAGKVALANRRTSEAREHFKAVLQREPHNADALIELGRLETAAGNDEAARLHFQAALRQRPRDTSLLLAVARAHAQSGNYHKALESGMSSIRLLKRSGRATQAYEAIVELGRLLSPGDKWAKARAEELFFEATKPKDAPAAPFLELGRLHRLRNDLARTVWCFRQAILRDPSHAEAHLELGMALRAKPQWRRDAKNVLRQYLRLRPDGKDAARVRALLERMR